MKKIRVGIADDNELSRQMLRAIAEMDTDLEIVGEAMSGVEALALVKSQKPGCHVIGCCHALRGWFRGFESGKRGGRYSDQVHYGQRTWGRACGG